MKVTLVIGNAILVPIGVYLLAHLAPLMLRLVIGSALLLRAVSLRWRDLDTSEGMLRVTGKGAKTRIVPVGQQALLALGALRRQDAGGDDDLILRGRNGRPLSTNGVRTRLRRRARDQGVWKRVYPHLLRHSCASTRRHAPGSRTAPVTPRRACRRRTR